MLRQGIRETSVIPKYPIGMRFAEGDRVFRYCHAGATLRALFEGHCGNFPREGETDAVEYPAGTNQITIPMNPNGDNYLAEVVADYWKGGYIWIQQGAPTFPTGIGQMYRIKSSAAAVGGFVVLTLEDSLKVTVAPSTWITAWPNIYSDIRRWDPRMSIVCLSLVPVPSGSYFWGQTWGPIFFTSGESPGRVDNDRELYFSDPHESIIPGSVVDFTKGNAIPQRAGFLITNTSPWTDPDEGAELGGDQFFMLQLAP